jgi:hypothetical protein
MHLPDGTRQILAALLASAGFLALYFGLSMVWWLAVSFAIVGYAALLLILRRRAPLSEMMLADRVSAADIAEADRLLAASASRVGKAFDAAMPDDRPILIEMQTLLTAIRGHISQDPADYRSSRRFITSYLPSMITNVEAYVSLSRRATGETQDRLARLRSGITTYAQVLKRIDQACLENDFRALEAEVDALGFQLQRG